jgi:sulfite reductase (NADPH) hemoprotein beta-component
VLASPNPIESRAHAAAYEWAKRLSEHLLPHTRAYHEIWLDGEKVAGSPDVEPIYGPTYLPRKFKAAIAVPPLNDVDVYAQDLGFIAILEDGDLLGFNLVVGGGLGTTHGEAATYPRLADLVGFLKPEQLLAVAEAVVTTQRDFGDRTNRRHARLKYTIDDRGLDWFRAEITRRQGFALEPARPFEFTSSGDRFGWTEGFDGRWHLTLRIESGRIADSAGGPRLTGLREIARVHRGDFRLTPNQNLIIANVEPSARTFIDALVVRYGLDAHARATPVHRDALACVALPTCSLAMAEAERYLPAFVRRVEDRLDAHGLLDEPITLRITGCPNGCARPYLAEIALIGKAPGRYNLYLGGDGRGQRLNALHLENVDEAAILAALDSAFARFVADRQPGERFGDFTWRAGLVSERKRA